MSSDVRRSSDAKPKSARKGPAKGAVHGRGEEVSAGGVLVRGEDVVVIVPTRLGPDGARVLALPKGHVDPPETPLEAAAREVHEETGVRGEPVCLLGETHYKYRRGERLVSKVVTFYLFRYVDGDTADHDQEVEEARWISLSEAEHALTHVGERRMVALARERLKEKENQAQDR